MQSKPAIDATTKAQLDKLGIQPTGSKEGDAAAIAAAQGTQSTESTSALTSTTDTTSLFATTSTEQSANTQQRPQIDESIKSQLDDLGIEPTGSRTGDLAAIKLELDAQKKELF